MQSWSERRSSDRRRGSLAPWQEKRLVAYIESNIGLSLHVADLAGLVQLSISHFSRAFSASFGEPPFAYIRARRIRHAQIMLLNTREPLSRVALECGMNDQAHFTRVFRKIVGVTPGLWRRRSATRFEDALQHDTHAHRKARHAQDQACRGLVRSEYTDE